MSVENLDGHDLRRNPIDSFPYDAGGAAPQLGLQFVPTVEQTSYGACAEVLPMNEHPLLRLASCPPASNKVKELTPP